MEKKPFVIGKPSINGPFSKAMLNNQRVKLFDTPLLTWIIFPLGAMQHQSVPVPFVDRFHQSVLGAPYPSYPNLWE